MLPKRTKKVRLGIVNAICSLKKVEIIFQRSAIPVFLVFEDFFVKGLELGGA